MKSPSELWLENHPEAVERNELLPKVDTSGQLWKHQQISEAKEEKRTRAEKDVKSQKQRRAIAVRKLRNEIGGFREDYG